MVHRLALALLYTFGTSLPVIQTSQFALVSIGAQLLHVFCQPMRGTEAQPYQAGLLMCLLLVTMSKIFEASTLQLASSQSDAQSTDYLSIITLLFGYVVPLAGVIVCFRNVIKEGLLKLHGYYKRCCAKPAPPSQSVHIALQ